MSTIRDAWLRKFATQLPLGIDIKDDDGNVIHSSIGDRKTHKITLYSAWLGKSSGGSTGGNTGGNTGDDGGDTGGTTTNPGHETVGDDVYPGDVNKGEVTKRFKLWQGPSNTNADTTVTFNQDLGENLDGLGDGLQAKLSMVETQYVDGKAAGSRKVNVGSVNDDWSYLTDLPMPVSFKKGRLASKDILTITLPVKNKKTYYSSTTIDIPAFSTAEEYPVLGTVADLPASTLNADGEIVPSRIDDTSFYISRPSARSGSRLVVTHEGIKIARGLIGQAQVTVNGVSPLTSFASGDFKLHYEDINGNITSNEVNIASFVTLKEYDESNSVYKVSTQAPLWVPTVTPYSNGFSTSMAISNTDKDKKVAIFDKNNNLMDANYWQSNSIVDGLEPDNVYSGFRLAIINARKIKDTDKIIAPSIGFQVGDDGNMLLKPTQGSVTDSDGNPIFTYDIVVEYINSYVSQKVVEQISTQNVLFHGSSTTAKLQGVDKDFNNIGDGLIINIVDPIVWSSVYSGILKMSTTKLRLPRLIKIPKSKIFSGVTNIDLSSEFSTYIGSHLSGIMKYNDGTWVDFINTNGYGIKGAEANLTLQNGSIELKANITMFLNSAGQSSLMPLQIASVSTYKEGE